MDFNIAISGLIISQKAMSVTQNNIANAHTPGYAREQLELGVLSSAGMSNVDAQIGSGVIATQVTRIRDEYLIHQDRNEMGNAGYYDQMTGMMSQVQSQMNENGKNSISTSMDSFFQAWTEASKFPEVGSYRSTLLENSKILSIRFNGVSDALDAVSKQTDEQISFEVTTVNGLTKKIADINAMMLNSNARNDSGLQDQRDQYLDELSKHFNMEVSVDSKNSVSVRFGNVTVINGSEHKDIRSMFDSTSGKYVLASNSTIINPTTGSLSGVLDSKTKISQYKTKIDNLVSTIITKVNAAHSAGYGLDGSTGNAFFTGTDAKTININAVLLTSPDKIGFAAAAGTSGDSGVAVQIAALKDSAMMPGKPGDYYNSLVSDVANDLKTSKSMSDMYAQLSVKSKSLREQVSGVNIDEEMTNLLKFQNYYQANAKVIKTIDDSFKELFSILG
jgi:flagellar hook-associated protein 1 FlgK